VGHADLHRDTAARKICCGRRRLEASSGDSPEVADAHPIASEIKPEAASDQPNPSRLKQLVMSAITTGAAALGQAATTDLVHLGGQALQTF
jgi:hypothetical protein